MHLLIPLGSATMPKSLFPFHFQVSRLTYLPLVTEKVTKHFNRYIANEHQDEVWFASNRRPLKWNCPIGKLFNLIPIPPKCLSDEHFAHFRSSL